MVKTVDEQSRLIIEQFTRQAIPFSRLPAHSTEESVNLVREAAEIGPQDTILDVACGPGLLACAFAPYAAQVTGIDLTPAMIEQAQANQHAKGLTNLSWRVGDVGALPFTDSSFSRVTTRYSFHHLLDPKAALAEMARVCSPGGRVVVVDVYSSSPEQAQAYDQVEKLRDPSHVRALGLEEFPRLFLNSGFEGVSTRFYKLDVDLEDLLASSFPNPGDDAKIRQIFTADLEHDRLGVGARLVHNRIRFAFPIVILVGRKPG